MNEQETTPNPAPFTGMSELWQLAWALQGVTRTIDVECTECAETAFERDRLSGLMAAAHMLSCRLLGLVDPFNDVVCTRHDAALARIAADTGETPAEAAARLLCEALDADTEQHEAEQAAEQARAERIEAARLKAKAAIYAAVDEMGAEQAAA